MDLNQFFKALIRELPKRAANKQQRAVKREQRFRAYRLKEANIKRERMVVEERRRLQLLNTTEEAERGE